MKLVNEKGKLFGIINLIDLVILLCVILIAGALVYKFASPAAADVIAPKSDMIVKLRIRGAMPYLTNEVMNDVVPGTRLVAGSDYVADAEVVSVESIPYLMSVTTDDGRIVTACDSTKSDLLITIRAKQNKNDPILKIGTQEVRIGRGYIFKCQKFEMNAIIETVEFDG